MQLKLKKIVPWVISIALLCTLAIVYVNKGINSVEASSSHKNHSTPHVATLPPQNDGATPIQANRLIPGATSGSPANIVYAPRDVVDMTRLVLETSNKVLTNADKYAEHTHKMIELSTQVIVVLFVVLGAIAGLWGIHKVDEFDEKVKNLLERHEASVESSASKANKELQGITNSHQAKAEEFLGSLDKQREVTVELIAGRIYIDQGLTYFDNGRADLAKEWFTTGVDRINRVLSNHPEVSPQSRLRSLAGVGYAYKRLGKIEMAYQSLVEAVKIAETHSDESMPFLYFNVSCYAALLSKTEECFDYLKKAIALDDEHRKFALNETALGGDFHSIKDSAEFLEIMKQKAPIKGL